MVVVVPPERGDTAAFESFVLLDAALIGTASRMSRTTAVANAPTHGRFPPRVLR
jgi:hypothetical protein